MKRVIVFFALAALAALILQPVAAGGNTFSVNKGILAEGSMPPPPFPDSAAIMAEGSMPPPPFPQSSAAMAV